MNVARQAVLFISAVAPTVSYAQEPTDPVGDLDGDIPADLTWRDIDGYDRQVATRFGDVEIAYIGDLIEGGDPTVEVRFNGALVQPPIARRGDFGIVTIREVFELEGEDIVLLAATAGGSGSPPPRLLLLAVSPDREPVLITDPEFRSVDWTQRAATDEAGVYFDLGFQQGQRKFAIYEGRGIDVLLADTRPGPLPASTCTYLHEAVSNGMCVLGQPFSQSVLRSLRALENRPGFESERVLRACEVARDSGEAPSFEAFANDICRIGE